jgi:hypothetical protein
MTQDALIRGVVEFVAERRAPLEEHHVYWTDEEDLALAYLAGLDAVQVGHGRFDSIFIAGDEAEEEHNLSKARRLLDGQPRSQRYLE